jgi:DNA helicase-2/ATP-dependent DNA helicase PcrA
MQFAADLHLHSRHSSAVSPLMTLEAIALWARRKGIDLIGTGDCLQPAWLQNLEEKLVEAEAGLFILAAERDEEILRELPAKLRAPLRFVLSTEVHCAPPGTPDLGGVHHLLYFRSFASARKLQRRLSPLGDLEEGRPRLELTSRQLLEIVGELGEGCLLAPAHVFNPFFATFGTLSGGKTLTETFSELAPHVTLVETGLTSTPPMCRRLSTLDRAALFSSSDAHSLENIGRECTIIECEPDYDALFAALRGGGSGRVLRTIKFPIERTRYYRNRCLECKKSFDGERCPRCGRSLVMGARDRLELVADRREPVFPVDAPSFRMVLPLRDVLAELLGVARQTKSVDAQYFRLLNTLGTERFILMDAPEALLSDGSTPDLARRIVRQRDHPPGRAEVEPVKAAENQMSFFEIDPPDQASSEITLTKARRVLADETAAE